MPLAVVRRRGIHRAGAASLRGFCRPVMSAAPVRAHQGIFRGALIMVNVLSYACIQFRKVEIRPQESRIEA